MRKKQAHALIALGANLPFSGKSPAETLESAVRALGDEGLISARLSAFYATPCFPKGAGPDYVNAAASLIVPEGWEADQVLQILHRIETRFGRTRETRWGMRTLDLDLIALDDLVLPDVATHAAWRALPLADQQRLAPERLILPHPRLQDRAFVLVPLADVAPDWRHPMNGLTVVQMLAALPAEDRDEVVRLSPQ